MAVQVVRIETYKTLDWALYQHDRGKKRPGTARVVEEPARIFEEDWEGAKHAMQGGQGQGGSKPNHAVEFVLTGIPKYGTSEAWDEATIDAWTQDAVNWRRDVI